MDTGGIHANILHCQPGGIFARTRSRPFTRTTEVVQRAHKSSFRNPRGRATREPSFGVPTGHPKASGATHDLLSTIINLRPRPAPFIGAPMTSFHALKSIIPWILTNSYLPPQGRKWSFDTRSQSTWCCAVVTDAFRG